MSRLRSLCLTQLFALCFVGGNIASAADQLSEIRSAWQRRRDAVQSLELRWTEQRFQVVSLENPKTGVDEGRQEVQFSVVDELKLLGDSWKLDSTRTSDKTGPLARIHTIQSLHGDTHIYFCHQLDRPSAVILSTSDVTFEVRPVALHYRPLTVAAAGFDMALAQIVGEQELDGASCTLVELADKAAGVRTVLWLSPEDDYAVMRYQFFLGARLGDELDMTYTVREQGQPQALSGWKLTRYVESGKIFQSTVATVSSSKLNPPIQAGAFDVEFPVGTTVADNRLGKKLMYIVREGGGKRVVPHWERLVPYATLVATEPGENPEALKVRGPTATTTVAVAVGVLLVALVGGYLISSRLRTHR